jgi:hypothetical protein
MPTFSNWWGRLQPANPSKARTSSSAISVPSAQCRGEDVNPDRSFPLSLLRVFLSVSASPRQNLFSPETSPQLIDSSSWRSHQTSTVAPAALRSREISAVSALSTVLTFLLLLRLFLRVSASPRQNHTLWFPSPFHHDPVRGMNSALPLRSLCLCGEWTAK